MRIYLYNRPFQCALQISHTKQAYLSLYFFYIKTKKCLSRLFNRQTNRQTNRRTRGSIGSRYVTLPIIIISDNEFGLNCTISVSIGQVISLASKKQSIMLFAPNQSQFSVTLLFCLFSEMLICDYIGNGSIS